MDNVNKEIAVGADEHDFHRQTDLAIGSIINTMIFGYRFTDVRKWFFVIIELFRKTKTNSIELRPEQLKSYVSLSGSLMFKSTKFIQHTLYLFPGSFTDPLISIGRFNKLFFDCFYFYCKRVVIAFEEIYAFLDKNIKARHLENLSFCGKQQYEDFVSQQPQDYLDAFFIEQVKLQQNGGNTADFYTYVGVFWWFWIVYAAEHWYLCFSVPQLKGMCFDLWLVGRNIWFFVVSDASLNDMNFYSSLVH